VGRAWHTHCAHHGGEQGHHGRACALFNALGAAMSVKLALLDDAGPTGGFFDARGPVPW